MHGVWGSENRPGRDWSRSSGALVRTFMLAVKKVLQ